MLAYFYFQIPEISEYIVSGGGVGGLNRSMSSASKAVTGGTVAVAAGTGAGVMRGLNESLARIRLKKH